MHLIDGQLAIGHVSGDLSKKLEDMYIIPLTKLVLKNDGYVFKRSQRLNLCKQITLLVDIKTFDKEAAWIELERLLSFKSYVLKDGYTRIFQQYRDTTG